MIPVSDAWSTANAAKSRTLVGRITFDRGGRKYSTHKIVDWLSEVLSDEPVLLLRFNESTGTDANDSAGHGLNGTYVNAKGFRTLALELGPFLYLRLNETTGTLAADSSGYGLDGTYVNGPTLGVPGALTGDPSDTAVTLNGASSQYITVADDPLLDLGTDTLSIAGLVYRTASGSQMYLVDKGANGYFLRIHSDDKLVFGKQDVADIVSSTIIVPLNAWSLVVATKSGATSKLYINGADVTGAVTNATIATTATQLNIGRAYTGANYLYGSLDELLLFPAALTAADVLALYNSSFGKMGVTGAIQGSSNKALLLNGISSYVSVADDPLLDLGTDTFTVEGLVYRTVSGVQQYIVDKGTNGYFVRIHSDNKLVVGKQDVADIVSSTIIVPLNAWTHWAWTKSGAANKLYLNGADVTGAVTNATIAATATQLNIGRAYGGTAYLSGAIDELSLFATALSPSRILAQYNASQLRQYLTVSADKIGYYATVLADAPSAWWHFGESMGTVAREAMNGLDGVYAGSPTLGVAGAINGNSDTAVTLNGSPQYIQVPDAALLDPGDVFSLECWVIRDSVTLDCLFDKGSNGYRLRIIAAADGNYLRLSKVGGAVICTSTVPVLLDGTWRHLVATKSGADVHLYIDGVDVSGAITNATIAATAIDLYIGVVNGGGSDWLQGSIDEPAIYPTALSAARVLAHYVAGSQDRSITGADPYIALIRSVASQIGTRTSKSSLSAMKFNITDVDNDFTAFMSEGLGGDKVTFDVGFRTIQGEEFAPFFTGNVEAVDLPDKLNEYEVTIRDPQVLTSKKIFTVASGLLTQNLATTPGSRYFHWITVTIPPFGRLPVNDNGLDVAAFTIAYDAYWGAGNWSFYQTSEAADGTNINLADTSAFSDAGDVVVDNEIISYTSKTATTLTGLTRQVGAASAWVGPHFTGARATEVFHLGPAHPLDILLDLYQESAPEGLAIPADRINLAGIAAAKALIGSTYEMEFWPSDPADAKSWLEQEIFAALGIYPTTTGAGLLGVKVEVVPVAADSVVTINHDNILSDAAGIPMMSWYENIESRINAVVFGYDYEKETKLYRTYKETVDSASIDRYGKIPYYVLSKGIYSSLTDTDALVAQISATLLTRYANAAPLLKIKTNMSLMTVDVGDIVTVESDLIPNRENGTRGLTDALFEVVRRQVNFDRNNCDFDLMLWVENP